MQPDISPLADESSQAENLLHKIAVVVPAYNEERKIGAVLQTIPSVISKIVVVDDASNDQTVSIVEEHARHDPRVNLIRHSNNQGPGGAMATGFKWARDNGMDVAILMAGDGQTSQDDLDAIALPILNNQVDYIKGNRLTHANANLIPKVRLLGNAALSFLTKIASGYWHVIDSQSGYTAANRIVLETIDWDGVYKNYGWPNDLLVRLNVHNFRVGDVSVKPIYGTDWSSSMKISKAAWRISGLLVRMFFWRLWNKYVVRSFHPLVLFYGLSLFFSTISLFLFVRILFVWSNTGTAPALSVLAFLFSVATLLQTAFFAMWMDMEDNRALNVRLPRNGASKTFQPPDA